MTQAHPSTTTEGKQEIVLRVRTIGIVLAAIVGTFSLAHLGVHLLAETGAIEHDGRPASRFDLGAEISIPSWFTTTLLSVVGAVCVGVAAVSQAAERRRWFVLAVIFVYLSVDEGSSLHEAIGEQVSTMLDIRSGPFFFAWVIPFGVVLLLAAPFLVALLMSFEPRVRRLFAFAGALYVTGAIGVEMIGGWMMGEVFNDRLDPGHAAVWLLVCLEESLENAGIVVATLAALVALRKALRQQQRPRFRLA